MRVLLGSFLLCVTPTLVALPVVTLEIPFQKTEVGLLLVHAVAAGRAGDFILDTGSEATFVDRTFLGLKKNSATLSGGVAVEATPADLGEFCIAEHCFGKTRVRLMNFDSISKSLGRPVNGMIGQDLMRSFDAMTIDYKRGVVVFVAAAH